MSADPRLAGRSQRGRRGVPPAGLTGALLALGLAALTAGSSPAETRPAGSAAAGAGATSPAADVEREGPVYRVGRFSVSYAEEHPDQPPLERLLPLRVRVGRLESGYVAPREGLPEETLEIGGPEEGAEVRDFHATAIGSISQQVLRALHRKHLLGVYVAPHPQDLDLASERDLRPPGDTELRLVISAARVRQVRTIATGDRVKTEWRIDSDAHRFIRDGSPIRPGAAATPGSTDLVRKDRLEEYLFRLNRHPGRRVEAALSASSDGKGAVLDYRVFEAKPWFVYARSSDTGSSRLARWQQRFGFVHNQAMGRDDILSLEYTNAGGDDLHALNFAYEAPWFPRKRPSWARGKVQYPTWLGWIDRDKLPWPGSDRLRWQVSSSWNRFRSAELEDGSRVSSDDWSVGGRLVYNVFQHRAFFLDLFAGHQIRGIARDSDVNSPTGRATLQVPEAGLQCERSDEYSNLRATLSWDANFASIDDPQLANLGSVDLDDTWHALHWDIGFTTYLEPLLNREAWEDPATARSSTLAHELALGLRGQYGFDYRIIPQATQVVGGFYSVRGYPQAAAVGDSVFLGSIEYRFHLPQSLPIRRDPMHVPLFGDFRVAPQQVYGRSDWDLVLRAFVDAGYATRNGGLREADGTRSEQPETLVGAGLGLELRVRHNLVIRTDWARALTSSNSVNNPTEAGNNEFHFLFSVLY